MGTLRKWGGTARKRGNRTLWRFSNYDVPIYAPGLWPRWKPTGMATGLSSDLQRVYAIEWLLTRIQTRTQVLQAEVFDAINDLLETIALTYSGAGNWKTIRDRCRIYCSRRFGAVHEWGY